MTWLFALATVAWGVVLLNRSMHTVAGGTNELMYQGKQFVRVLPPGTHFVPPFGVEFKVVHMGRQRMDFKVSAITAEGIQVRLGIQLIYAVVDARTFASRRQVFTGFPLTAAGVIRQEIARFAIPQLIGASGTLQSYLASALSLQATVHGITLDDVTIYDAEVPLMVLARHEAAFAREAPYPLRLLEIDAIRRLAEQSQPRLNGPKANFSR